jgi:prephenate dehydrogenase
MTGKIDRVLILGTGLLGASTGLALRAAGFRGAIAGWDKDEDQATVAVSKGAIDEALPTQAAALQRAIDSQIVVLATPVYAILDWMEQLAPRLGPSHLITDVGSTKALITSAGNRLFNRNSTAGFLPGHPMAGKEVGGAADAEAAMLQDAVWIFTGGDAEISNAEGMSGQAAALAVEWRGWVEAFGCRLLDLDAARHDELVAWVSHLPQFLATALTALLETEVGDAPELTAVGGRALREMTRLGSSPYSMWRDVALTNTDAIANALQALEQRLAHLRENLRTPELRDEFEQARRFRKP